MLGTRLTAALCVLGWLANFARADSVVAWGLNNLGQLGNGTSGGASANAASPVAVSTLGNNVAAVSAGGDHSLALKNGAVYAWGLNVNGQLGTNSTSNSNLPVAASVLTSGVSLIASGFQNSLAVRNGGVYAWGYNADGELGNGNTTTSTKPIVINSLSSGVSAIAAGSGHCLAIQNGAVYSWGENNEGQLGNGSTTNSSTPLAVPGLTSGVTAIAAGFYHSLAIQNGAVYNWGEIGYYAIGSGPVGAHDDVPTAVAGLSSGVTAIAGGGSFSLAVQNGSVYAWGSNFYGQLGDGTVHNRLTPIAVSGIQGTITAVAATQNSSYALSADGSLWVWGLNTHGELGLGDNYKRLTPTQLLAPAGYAYTSVDADAYGLHVLATLATIASFGDVNADNKVDIADLGLLATYYGQSGTNLPGDINNDGVVNIADLGILATHYGFGSTSGAEVPFAVALKRLGLPAVPEPSTLCFSVLSLSVLRRRRLA